MVRIASGAFNPLATSASPNQVNIARVGGSVIALGQAAMAASFPVVIASDQSDIPVSQVTASNLNAQVRPDAYATDDTAMPATPRVFPIASEYRASATTYTDGDATVLQSDVNGNLKDTLATLVAGEDLTNNVLGTLPKPAASSTYSASRFGIFGTDVDLSVKASAGNLFSIVASNINAAVRYLQVHNKASAPSSGNTPVLSLPIPAGSATVPGYLTLGREIFGEGGSYLSTGIAIGISTAEATFTAATTTDHDFYGEYI